MIPDFRSVPMFRPANRMRRREEFNSAVRQGRRAGRPLLVVHLRRSDSGASPRVGFTVSRAIGNAVTRNRVRRRLRHLMAERLHVLPEGSLLVLRANRAAADAGFTELAGDLDRALDRVLRVPTGQVGRSGERG